MKGRILSGIIIVVVIALAFLSRLLHPIIFDALIMALSICCTLELLKSLGDRVKKAHKWLAIIFPITLFPIAEFMQLFSLIYAVAYILFALVIVVTTFKQEVVDGEPQPINYSEFGTLLLVLLYPTVPLLFLTLINVTLPEQTKLFALLVAFLSSTVSDVFAFLFGSLIKGKKLASAISPNKTISGTVAGVIASAIVSVALYYIFVAFGNNPFGELNTLSVILFLVISGLFFGVSSQMGDLFESAFKRSIGVKDTGRLLPGHGGLLDRADSLIFTAVAVYMIYSFL